MGLRTYLPYLRFLAEQFCAYIDRNRPKIIEFIGEDNIAILDAANAACAALDVVLNTVIPPSS